MDPVTDAPLEGQDVESLAKSLFSEDIPEPVEVEETTTLLEPNNVVPITPVVPVQGTEQPVVLNQEKLKQFEAWQALQQQQQQVPVVPVQQQQQQVVPQQQQLDPAEADRLLNRFTLGQKEYDAIFKTDSEEQSIAALNAVLQNTVKQAVTMAFHLVKDTENKVLSTVQPYMGFADSQREIMLRETFFAEHPTLRGADPILNAVMTQMTQSGQKFTTQKELFDAVAKSTKDQLALLGVTQGQANTQTKQGVPSVKKPMASLPTGGQGGSQQSAAQGQSGGSNTARAIFG